MTRQQRRAAERRRGKPDEHQGKPGERGVKCLGTIPVEDLVVPHDHLGLTFTWPKGCSSIVLPLSDLDKVLTRVEEGFEFQPGDRADFHKHARVRRAVVEILKRDVASALMIVLWLAIEHPLSGRKVREAISAAVQERRSARLCAEVHSGGRWAFAVAPGHVPLSGLLNEAERRAVPTFVEYSSNEPRGSLQ